MNPLTADVLQKAIQSWLQVAEHDSKTYFRTLINDVGSVRTIHGIKNAAIDISMNEVLLSI